MKTFAVFEVLSSITSMLFSYAAAAAAFVGMWFTFKKMGKPGWKGIIPFYNLYVIFEEVWEKKEFWRLVTYLCVFAGACVFGSIMTAIGGVSIGAGYGYESGGATAVGVILLILGISLIIGSLVFVVLSIVQEYKLFRRLAFAFGLKPAWAWGLLFLPYVFFIIIGFHKRITYFRPVGPV